MEPIKTLIVDDHPMVIEGVKALLQNVEHIHIEGTVNDAFSAVDFLKKNKVEVVLMDINLPDLNGIDLCGKLKEDYPKLKILAMSTFKERSCITRIIEQSASGYVLKNPVYHGLNLCSLFSEINENYRQPDIFRISTA